MSKWQSVGYVPGSGPEIEWTRQVEKQLLREHLSILVASSRRIIETPRYFFCGPVSAWLSTWFLYGGGGRIPLGVLCLLWEAGEMVFECPGCGGVLYAVGVGGSPFSGSATAWGVCVGCRTWQRQPDAGGSRTIHVVGGLLGGYRNEPVIERGKQPRFDWKEGLVGESTPDRVIVPAVVHVDLSTLIGDLTDHRGEESGRVFAPASRSAMVPREEKRPSGMTFPLLLEKKSH